MSRSPEGPVSSAVRTGFLVCPPTHPGGYGVLSYGFLCGSSGSGQRGQDAGSPLPVPHEARARSYSPPVFTKPNTGRRGARGAGWRNKCPDERTARLGLGLKEQN